MFLEPTTLQWTEIIVVGVIGTISVPFIMYALNQNSNRKAEIAKAFESVNTQVSIDRAAAVQKTDELGNKLVRLETIVDLKKETVDKVQSEQNQANTKVALLEASVTSIKESQARVETHWLTVSEKLESLVGIKEQIKGLTEDVREIKEAQNKN